MKKKELKKSSPKKNKEGEEIWIKRIKEDYMFRNPECKKCGATIYNLRESKLFKKPASIVSLPIPVINGIPNPTDNNSSNHPLRHKERKSEAALKKKLQELLICKQCYYSNKRRTIGIILLLIILIIISIFILKSIF